MNIIRSFFYGFKKETHLINPLAQVIDHTAKDPVTIIPAEIVLEIFSYLNHHDLGVCRSVSRKWLKLADTPNLWKEAIYREIAFTSKDWVKVDKDIVKDVDFSKEALSFPDNIVEELRLSHKAFPRKSIRQSHVLVIKPKGLTINKIGELLKKYFPNNADGYSYISKSVADELGGKSSDESVWLLMTTHVLEGTRNKSFQKQKEIVKNFASKTKVPYKDPTTLDALICILAEYFRTKKRLFNGGLLTYTRCQENIQGFQVDAGGFDQAGLRVFCNNYDHLSIGLAGLHVLRPLV